jgi:hypothetical protein
MHARRRLPGLAGGIICEAFFFHAAAHIGSGPMFLDLTSSWLRAWFLFWNFWFYGLHLEG